MKKCPYCAEEIQDEAIFCRYCRHELKEVSKGQGIVVAASGLREPPVWESLFFALIFIVFTDILLVGIAMAFSMATGIVADENLQLLGIAVGLLARVVVGVVSVKGFRPTGATAINYIGMILLAFVPIGSWIPTYYAGKAIARRVPKKATIILMTIIVGICLLVSIPFLLNNPSLGKQSLATQTWAKPTSVQIVQPNITQTIKRTPTSSFPDHPQIKTDVENWLQNETPFLWDLVEGQAVGHDLVYNINLEDDPVLLGEGWCSKSSAILDENWRNLSLSFTVDEIELTQGNFLTTDYDGEVEVSGVGKQSGKCRIIYFGLYGWPKGNHEIVAIRHTNSGLFDGWGNIPANVTYKSIYHVNVNQEITSKSPNIPYGCKSVTEVGLNEVGTSLCVFGLIKYTEYNYVQVSNSQSIIDSTEIFLDGVPYIVIRDPWSRSKEHIIGKCIFAYGIFSSMNRTGGTGQFYGEGYLLKAENAEIIECP